MLICQNAGRHWHARKSNWTHRGWQCQDDANICHASCWEQHHFDQCCHASLCSYVLRQTADEMPMNDVESLGPTQHFNTPHATDANKAYPCSSESLLTWAVSCRMPFCRTATATLQGHSLSSQESRLPSRLYKRIMENQWSKLSAPTFPRPTIKRLKEGALLPLCWPQWLKWKIWGEKNYIFSMGPKISAWAPSHEGRAHHMLMRVNIWCLFCLSFSQSVHVFY